MIEWFTQNQNTNVNGYGFRYDGLNRLKAGIFFSRFDASAIVEPMPTYNADGIVSGIGSEKEITYDKNGNILTLNRYGHHSGGTVLFDQLSYQYDGNRLMRVIDANPNSFLSGEFCNTAAPNLQNSYDANGNLTFDVDRNMLLFYNDDNLPTNISFSNWAMTNAYRADGVKMSKSMYNAEGRAVLQEEYFGNLVLNFGKPVRILHADGVIELSVSLQPTFYYYLKDHLGNIRAVVSPTATNSVHIDQTSEYYPFGMNISKNFTSTSINKYKYNGKEEQEMPGHWLDYGARFYDPQMGRFTTVDLMAEQMLSMSPYCYAANNPVRLIDADGFAPGDPLGPGNYKASINSRYIGFGLRNPVAATRIGFGVTPGATNISTNATRFATRGEVLYGSKRGQEDRVSENGAFRHALWQATITSEFGGSVAAQAGNAHEENAFTDLSIRSFSNVDEADQTVDLLNNVIGRSIGAANQGAKMNELANLVLDEFKNNGLYTATIDKDGYWVVLKTTLSSQKYNQLKEIFKGLNENGRTAAEQQKVDAEAQKRLDELQQTWGTMK